MRVATSGPADDGSDTAAVPLASAGATARPDVVLLAGPTASGKSSLAIAIAEQLGGAVVNADSMQVYDVLRVLTARPDDDDLARVPHKLFGHVDPARAYSVAAWLEDARSVLDALRLQATPAIFCGGTGLYFKALEQGLAGAPDIPVPLRERVREDLRRDGAPALHRRLAERDPASAARLRPSDGQRIARALEVALATQDGQAPGKGLAPVLRGTDRVDRILLRPDRAWLHRRIEARAATMLEEGAADEVARLRALDLPPDLPAMRAIGVPQLGKPIDGEQDLTAALSSIQAATRQYCKRQYTWFRGHMGEGWEVLDPSAVDLAAWARDRYGAHGGRQPKLQALQA